MVIDIVEHARPFHSYWRTTPFAELIQLYVTRFLRRVAQGMVGVIMVVFLYQQGCSASVIMLYIAFYYFIRTVSSFMLGYYVAWAGPKRAVLMSNIVAIPSFVVLTVIDINMIIAVLLYFFLQAVSSSLYSIASDMHFSSLQSTRHAGKEIGWMNIFEKVATSIAPMFGGFIAFACGPRSTIWVAAILSVFAAIPLFITPEKIRRQQRIIYRGIPWHTVRGQLVSNSLAGVDQVTSTATWALFVGIIILGADTDAVYAKLGIILSLSLFVSIGSTYLYGVIIDRHKGRVLYCTGVLMNSVVHAIRPFVTTPLSVVLLNTANEVGTSAYSMPYVRTTFDIADSLPGYRVAYISVSATVFCFGAMTFALITATLLWFFDMRIALGVSFFMAAILTLGLLRYGAVPLRGNS